MKNLKIVVIAIVASISMFSLQAMSSNSNALDRAWQRLTAGPSYSNQDKQNFNDLRSRGFKFSKQFVKEHSNKNNYPRDEEVKRKLNLTAQEWTRLSDLDRSRRQLPEPDLPAEEKYIPYQPKTNAGFKFNPPNF